MWLLELQLLTHYRKRLLARSRLLFAGGGGRTAAALEGKLWRNIWSPRQPGEHASGISFLQRVIEWQPQLLHPAPRPSPRWGHASHGFSGPMTECHRSLRRGQLLGALGLLWEGLVGDFKTTLRPPRLPSAQPAVPLSCTRLVVSRPSLFFLKGVFPNKYFARLMPSLGLFLGGPKVTVPTWDWQLPQFDQQASEPAQFREKGIRNRTFAPGSSDTPPYVWPSSLGSPPLGIKADSVLYPPSSLCVWSSDCLEPKGKGELSIQASQTLTNYLVEVLFFLWKCF